MALHIISQTSVGHLVNVSHDGCVTLSAAQICKASPSGSDVTQDDFDCGTMKRGKSPYRDGIFTGRYDFTAKLILLGDFGIGKSSMLKTLSTVENPQDLSGYQCVLYRPNEYVEVECIRNGKRVLVKIMDTGGQERFRSMTSSYYRGAHGCLLMFDVTNEASFDSVINWFNDMHVYSSSEHISAILVGTMTSERERQVTSDRAFKLAESLKLTYLETSVQDQQMVLWIMQRLLNTIIMTHARRQSLVINIMPSVNEKAKVRKKGLKCCPS